VTLALLCTVVGRTGGGDGDMKMDDVMHSIKAEARSKLGTGPSMSARVASAKQQQSLEEHSKQGADETKTADDDDDAELGNFDQDDDHTEATEASEAKAALKKKKSRKMKNVMAAATSISKGSKARRGSFGDKTGLREVLSAASLAAAAATPTKSAASRGKTTKKGAKRASRRSFDGSAGVPMGSGDSGDHDGEGHAVDEEGHLSDHEQEHDDVGTDLHSAIAAAAALVERTAPKTTAAKSKSPKKTTKRTKRRSFDGSVAPTDTETGTNLTAADVDESHASDHEQVAQEGGEGHDLEDTHEDGAEDTFEEEHDEGDGETETDGGTRKSPTKKKRAAKAAAGKPPKGPKRPQSREVLTSSAENTPASTPLKSKRSAANVKPATKAEKTEKKDGKTERAKPKRRRSFGGDEPPGSQPPSRPDSRADESRPTTRGSDTGADASLRTSADDGEGTEEQAVPVLKPKARSNRPLVEERDEDDDGAGADEQRAVESRSALQSAGSDGAHDDEEEHGLVEEDAEDGEGAQAEGEEQGDAGDDVAATPLASDRQDGSESGSKPSSSRRPAPSAKVATKAGKSAKQPAASRKVAAAKVAAAAADDTDAGEGDGERSGSREGTKSRTPSPSKKATTSKDLKREAMEKERVAGAATKQKAVRTVAPNLDGVKKDRRSKPALPKRGDGTRKSTSREKPSGAGSDAVAVEGGDREDEGAAATGDNTANHTEANTAENSEDEDAADEDAYDEEGEEEEQEEEEEVRLNKSGAAAVKCLTPS
jgi:hypothetical protein